MLVSKGGQRSFLLNISLLKVMGQRRPSSSLTRALNFVRCRNKSAQNLIRCMIPRAAGVRSCAHSANVFKTSNEWSTKHVWYDFDE